jgi:hypothetical protein
MLNVIKGLFIKRATTLSLIAISLTLTFVQNPLTPAVAAVCGGKAAYPPDLPDCLDPVVEAKPVATTAAPLAKPMPSPIALPPVTAPVQVVVVKANEKPAAPAVPVAANNTLSQVAVDGKFVTIQIAPQKNPSPGTVGVAVVGDGFNFSLSTTSKDDAKTTIGSVTVIDGKPVVNAPQQTTISTTGTGFRSNDQVALYVFSTEKFLGNITTSNIGEFNAKVTLPILPLGPHHFQATGLTKDGKTRTITLFMNITAAAVASPAAQSSATLLMLLATLLLLFVLFWVFLAKKRNSKEDESNLISLRPKTPKYSDDLVDINSRINALIKKQAATKKRATASVKAYPRKKAVSKKRAKI